MIKDILFYAPLLLCLVFTISVQAQDPVPCENGEVGNLFCPEIEQQYTIFATNGDNLGVLNVSYSSTNGLQFDAALIPGWGLLSYFLDPRAVPFLGLNSNPSLFALGQSFFPPPASVSINVPLSSFPHVSDVISAFESNQECQEVDLYFSFFLFVVNDDGSIFTSAWADGVNVTEVDECEPSETTESTFTLSCCCAE